MRKVQDRKWEQLLWKLDREHRLSAGEWKDLLEAESREAGNLAADLAKRRAVEQFGKKIYIRGLVEISSYCKTTAFTVESAAATAGRPATG